MLCYSFTVLPSPYNIEFSRHSDTSSLKFILKLLMFDHSLRHFVLKFAELRDLQEPGGSSRTRTRNSRAESDLSAAARCEMIHGDWGRKYQKVYIPWQRSDILKHQLCIEDINLFLFNINIICQDVRSLKLKVLDSKLYLTKRIRCCKMIPLYEKYESGERYLQ